MAEKAADRVAPSKIGRYQVLDRLAAGGMAEVYRARSASDGNRLIAIKCMLPALVDDEEFANMFVDEAKLASQLSHPNIVQIYELGRYKEQLYIAMELIHGRDLRAIVRKAKKKGVALSPQFVAYVVAKTAEALDYAHRKTSIDGRPLKLVHRDISPQNILVGYDGNVKVVDFGIAKADFRRTMSRVGILKGKFAYMAPEQVKTGEVDGRTDIFALGAVLYEAFAHRKLFYGESDFSILERVTNGTLPDDLGAWDRLPEQVAKVVRRAVTVDPADRYQEASNLAEALEPLLIDGRTIYGPKQARELMRELFQQEIADNDMALHSFAQTAGEMSGILRRPSQKVEKVEKPPVDDDDEKPGRDWSIVTRDPAKAAEEVEKEIERDRESRSGRGRDESNTAGEYLQNTNTRPDPNRRPSGRQRRVDEDAETRVTSIEQIPTDKQKKLRAVPLTAAPAKEDRGIPLVGGVIGGTPDQQRKRLLYTLTSAIVVLLVLLGIVMVRRARPPMETVEAPEKQQEEIAVVEEPPRPAAVPRVTTTPLEQPEAAPAKEPDKVAASANDDAKPVAPTAQPAAPTKAAPEPQYAYLSVKTADGRPATVFIDKKEVGPAPIVKRRMPYGEHIVRVVDKANRAKVLQVILTSKNQKAPMELTVSP